MPQNSPFPIILSTDEEYRLQQTARQDTSPYFDVMRTRIVLLAAQGLQNKQIGGSPGSSGPAGEAIPR